MYRSVPTTASMMRALPSPRRGESAIEKFVSPGDIGRSLYGRLNPQNPEDTPRIGDRRSFGRRRRCWECRDRHGPVLTGAAALIVAARADCAPPDARSQEARLTKDKKNNPPKLTPEAALQTEERGGAAKEDGGPAARGARLRPGAPNRFDHPARSMARDALEVTNNTS